VLIDGMTPRPAPGAVFGATLVTKYLKPEKRAAGPNYRIGYEGIEQDAISEGCKAKQATKRDKTTLRLLCRSPRTTTTHAPDD